MKIIYIHQYFNTPRMTGGTRSFEMARRLVAMGHEVHIVTSSRDHSSSKDSYFTREEGINVHWIPVAYSNKYGDINRIFAFLKFAWGATIKGISLQGDVVFATSTPLTVALPGYLVSRKLSVPMVFEVRDLWPILPIAIGSLKNPLLQWLAFKLERFAYVNSSRIVALSEGMKEGVVATGYDPDKVSVIPNSCDLDLFNVDDKVNRSLDFRARNNIPNDAILVVYAGTFGRINGVDYLVNLADRLKDLPNIQFLAIGDGAEFDKITELAQSRGVLGKNFLILGGVSKLEMVNVLAAADLATSLFIPLEEMEANSANKFFDALAAGCPILINYGGWQAKLLIVNEAGMQLDRDISVPADQMRMLLSSPDRIGSWGFNSRKLGELNFSRDELAIELEQVLSKAVNESDRSYRVKTDG